MIILFDFFLEEETGHKITSGHDLKDFVIMTTFILKETLQFLRIKKWKFLERSKSIRSFQGECICFKAIFLNFFFPNQGF